MFLGSRASLLQCLCHLIYGIARQVEGKPPANKGENKIHGGVSGGDFGLFVGAGSGGGQNGRDGSDEVFGKRSSKGRRDCTIERYFLLEMAWQVMDEF